MKEKTNNLVAKHARKYNKSAVHKDRKKAMKKGERKHKGQYENIGEKLSASDGVAAWIKDFQQSDAPQFAGKSAEKRKEMALAAYLDAKKGSKEEACWQGYTQKGMKKKGDRVVPNCVPEETDLQERPDGVGGTTYTSHSMRKKAMQNPKVAKRVADVQKREKERKAGMSFSQKRALAKRQRAGQIKRHQSNNARADDANRKAGRIESVEEDLRKWFGKGKKGDWVRVGTDGEIKGDCAREPGEGKPKCMPRDKAHSMSKKDRGSAARRKRAKDPVVDRPGTGNKPIMVKTDKKESIEEKNEPTNPKLWAKFKAQAKAKFDVYPSAYANGWAAKQYKAAGGGWKTVKEGSAQDRLNRRAAKHGLGKPNKAADDYMAMMRKKYGAKDDADLKRKMGMKEGKHKKVIPAPKSDMAKRLARGQRNDPVNKIRAKEDVNELKKSTMKSYVGKALKSDKKERDAGGKTNRRHDGIMRAHQKLRKEENIDELSTKTLGSYISKASDARGHKKLSTAKQDKRYSGVARASRKMDKKLSGESVNELTKRDMEMMAKRKQSNLVKRGKAKPEPKKPTQKKPEANINTVASKQGQDDNLIMQLRKAQDRNGNMEVKFTGGKMKLPKSLIDKLLKTYDRLSKPADKKKFSAMVTKELRARSGKGPSRQKTSSDRAMDAFTSRKGIRPPKKSGSKGPSDRELRDIERGK